MHTKRLGSSDLEVTVVGLGCNNFGGRIDEEASRAVIDAALEAGVTFFDTADVYGDRGGSEEIIGRALGSRRDQVVLATKFGHDLGDGETARGSRSYIRKAVKASLRRLQTDRIDLYQYHRPDGVTPLEETLGALHELVQEGKVRAIGSSNFTAAMVEEADAIAGERGPTPSPPSRASTRGSRAPRRTSCCRPASGSAWASSRTSRLRAGCSPASTGVASRRRRDPSAWPRARRGEARPRGAARGIRERARRDAPRGRDRRAAGAAGRGLGDRRCDEAGADPGERPGGNLGAVGRGPGRAPFAVTFVSNLATARRKTPHVAQIALVSRRRRLRRFAVLRARRPSVQSNNPPPNVTIVLECLECGARDDVAKGWRAYLEPEADGVLVFCPSCAEREFGCGD